MIDEIRTFEIYGYTSDELLPHSHKKIVRLCDECGKHSHIQMGTYSNAKHCGLCKSCIMKILYESPGTRKKHSETMKLVCKSPAAIKQKSEVMKKRYEAPDTREKLSETMKSVYEDSAIRKKHSETMKALYDNDPAIRNKISESMKRLYIDNPALRNKVSKTSKERWDNPTERKKMCEAQKKRWSDPKEHERSSAAHYGIPYSEWARFAQDHKYCDKFDESLKKEIRDIYNNCDYVSGIHKDICNHGRELSVHHVDYDRMQGCDNKKWCLIPLSMSNHGKTNGNKWFWNRLFVYALDIDRYYYNTEEVRPSIYKQ